MVRGRRTTVAARTVAFVVLSVLAAGLSTVSATSVSATTARAADAVVTFPAVTRINGTTTDYVLTIDDPGGSGTLIAWWEGTDSGTVEVVLPDHGQVALRMAASITENAQVEVHVSRCPGTRLVDECEVLHHAGLEVLVRPWAQGVGDPVQVGSVPRPTSWGYLPHGSGTTRWRLLAADGSLLSEGTTAPGRQPSPSLTVPVGTTPQDGVLVLDHLVDTDVGPLSGTQRVEARLDGTPPPPPTVTLSDTTLYPYEDTYRDTLTVSVGAEPGTQVTVWADDEAGRSVRLDSYVATRTTRAIEFWGRDGQRVLYGTYRIRAVSADSYGNPATTVSAPVVLRAERMVPRAWERTLPATRTVVDRWTGSCAALRTPASRGWRRSLAYVSGRCRPLRQSAVQALHTVRVPRSPIDRYRSVEVSLYGGPSRSALRGSYLVMGYHPAADPAAFEHRHVFNGMRLQRRRGEKAYDAAAEALVHGRDGAGRPAVVWSTGLAGGSRYDVRSFTVAVSYYVLADPPGA